MSVDANPERKTEFLHVYEHFLTVKGRRSMRKEFE